MALTKTPIELSSTPSIVDGGNATAITIDSSENVLISGTSSSIDAGSISLEAQGRIRAGRSGGTVLQLNRTTSDGDVAIFYKDGSVVGSIGTENSHIYMTGSGAAAAGLRLQSNNIITPMTNGSLSDNTVDLGYSTNRFKDLYLSGGAYLGGTAASNKLEDYEEGTWTPTDGGTADASISIVSANYTKIGRLVTLSIYVTVTATSAIGARIGNLPFTPIAGNAYAISPLNHNGNVGTPLFRVNSGSTEAVVLNFNNTNVTFADLNNSIFITSITYMTA